MTPSFKSLYKHIYHRPSVVNHCSKECSNDASCSLSVTSCKQSSHELLASPNMIPNKTASHNLNRLNEQFSTLFESISRANGNLYHQHQHCCLIKCLNKRITNSKQFKHTHTHRVWSRLTVLTFLRDLKSSCSLVLSFFCCSFALATDVLLSGGWSQRMNSREEQDSRVFFRRRGMSKPFNSTADKAGGQTGVAPPFLLLPLLPHPVPSYSFFSQLSCQYNSFSFPTFVSLKVHRGTRSEWLPLSS